MFSARLEFLAAATSLPPLRLFRSGGTAGSRVTCSDFRYQEDAQASLGSNLQLDGDNDGIACELPHRPNTPSSPSTVLAEGLYAGTLNGSTSNTSFQMLALENGDVWALYGDTAGGGSFVVNGFVQGPTSRTSTSFSSSTVKDFGFNPAAASTAGQHHQQLRERHDHYGWSIRVVHGRPSHVDRVYL